MSIKLWCHLESQPLYFSISISPSQTIFDLKEQIHEKYINSLREIYPEALTVTKVDADINDENVRDRLTKGEYRPNSDDQLLEQIKEVREVWPEQPDKSHLHVFVGRPAAMVAPTTGVLVKNVDVLRVYRNTFVKVKNWGGFEYSDLERNRIVKDTITAIPEFVATFEHKLVREPRVSRDTALELTQDMLRNLRKHFKLSEDLVVETRGEMPHAEDAIVEDESDEESRYAERHEAAHTALHMALYDWKTFWEAEGPSRSPLKGRVASSLLFDPFIHAPKNEVTPSHVVENKNLPITLVVEHEDDRETREFHPSPDFQISVSKLPRLLVEVNSTPVGLWPTDLVRMLATGAFIVRFANEFLSAFREKNFVLCTFFIWADGIATRCTLYQKREDDAVYYREKKISLNETDGRAEFTRHLHNLRWPRLDPDEAQETNKKVKRLNEIIMSRNMLSMYSIDRAANNARKRARTDNGSAGSEGTWGGHGQAQLRAHGYEIKSEITEDAGGGDWGPIGKIPDHILTVYRPLDSSKEFIAKKIRDESQEIKIFSLLEAIPCKSDHIIRLIDSFRGWVILPKMVTVGHYLDSSRPVSASEVSKLCSGLIDGLAYLHGRCIAHRDIKPDNLVVDNSWCLKIIDFDSAMKVEDEDEEVDGPCGTARWMAPEVEKNLKHSPIRADRWSCGRVLLTLLQAFETEDEPVRAFGTKLMAHNPKQRPSLLDWHDYSGPRIWHDGKVMNVEARKALRFGQGQDQVKSVVNGEYAKPPSAKRRKFSVEE